MAAQQLLEAAVKEATVEAIASSKDAIAELKHLHGGTDKLLALGQELLTAMKAQSRRQAIQAAMSLSTSVGFEYYIKDTGYRNYYSQKSRSEAVELLLNVLRNALRGVNSWVPEGAAISESGSYNEAAFRTALSTALNGITGIQPLVEASQDGKRYTIYLP
ncbi:hypothetical protein GPECTOR_42g813 [Gonium pectorale]|uniref:Uncharacterized protein n=1 Tax=Gonium pectorale TaxID=33097 RepID=A0A150G9T6_GONPE|nr:hypothetical protein GPECTOR_42g813 [Gonium pectorale]|eukprot:KXZ46602.1 hypothetical protein GPECTOR_42g813 [Gonium pectorale]